MSFILAELREWLKVPSKRDNTYQGYIYNDGGHTKDGTFMTIEADTIEVNSAGHVITSKNHVFILWFTKQKVTYGDQSSFL